MSSFTEEQLGLYLSRVKDCISVQLGLISYQLRFNDCNTDPTLRRSVTNIETTQLMQLVY